MSGAGLPSPNQQQQRQQQGRSAISRSPFQGGARAESNDCVNNSSLNSPGPNRALPSPPTKSLSNLSLGSRLNKTISGGAGSANAVDSPRNSIGRGILESPHRRTESTSSSSQVDSRSQAMGSGRFDAFTQKLHKADSGSSREDNRSGSPRSGSNEYETFKNVFNRTTVHHRSNPSVGSLAFGDADNLEPIPAPLTQASVDVVQVQHVAAGMALNATPDSDSQVREEIRLMAHVRDRQLHDGEFSISVEEPLEKLAAFYDQSGNYERRRDILLTLAKLTELNYGEVHAKVSDTLTALGSTYLMLGDDTRAKEVLERARRIEEEEFGLEHPELARTLVLLGHTYSRLDKVPEQIANAERAARILGNASSDDDCMLLTEALSLMSEAYQKMGDHEHQRDACLRELAIRVNLLGPEDIGLVPVMRTLASAFNSLGEFHKEKDVLQKAITIQDSGPVERDLLKLISTLSMLARTYSELEEFESARSTLERVLDIKRKRYGPTTSTVLQTLWELAGVADDLGELAESRRYLDEALTLAESLYGGQDRRVAFILAHLALCHARQGDGSILTEYYQRSLAIIEQIYGTHHVIIATTLKLFGQASCELGDYNRQKKLLKKILSLEQTIHTADSEPIALTMAELGGCEGRLGQFGIQRQLQEEALMTLTKLDSGLHYRAEILIGLAKCYSVQGEHELARDALLRLIKLEERAHGQESVLVALTIFQLVKSYMELGDLDQARAYNSKCAPILRGYFKSETHPVIVQLESWSEGFIAPISKSK